MPKSRKPAGSRRCAKRIYILCEGSDKHSEYAYLSALIKDTPLQGNTVQIELVPNAKKLRSEVEKYDSDKKIYERNPYTNLDLLVEEIQHPDLKENTEAFWDEFYK